MVVSPYSADTAAALIGVNRRDKVAELTQIAALLTANMRFLDDYAASKSGTDWTPALTALLADAEDGDILYLGDAYRLDTPGIAITKAVTITGPQGKGFDIRTAVSASEKLFNVTADNVAFLNVAFDATNAPAGNLTSRHTCIYATSTDNLRVEGCTFTNLKRQESTHSAGGTASLESDYCVLATGCTNVQVRACRASEISGCFAFVVNCRGVWVTDNYVEMLSTAQCLYPIHADGGNDGVWFERNYVKGGNRRSGGAVDVMGIDNPNKRVHVNRNIIDGCNGDGSATSVLRMLSTEDGELVGNIVRGVTSQYAVLLNVNYRDLPTAQPGPLHNLIADNILICGAADQRAMDIRNDHASGTGGEDVTVRGNQCLSDGTNRFAAGIRARDIDRLRVLDNVVIYSYSSNWNTNQGASWGIDIAGSLITTSRPIVRGNTVDCGASATSRGIEVQGTVAEPIIDNNEILDWVSFGLRIENTVSAPTIRGNTFKSAALGSTAVSNQATGNSMRRDNRLTTDAVAGTWTITAGGGSVTISTAEVQVGDVILITIRSSNTTDKAVKVDVITADTSFRIRTLDHANISTNDMTGTWQIVH